MERELWPLLYRTVREVARGFSQKYVHIPGWVLLVTLLWAALHDRPGRGPASAPIGKQHACSPAACHPQQP